MVNIFEIYKNSSSSLKSHIRIKDFETIVNERTKYFVGREFIFNKIDEIIDDPEFTSGYIVIKGEPGIGKTSLISQLVKQRGYVHHFNSSKENIRSTHVFLSNICAQLVVKYSLEHDRFPDKGTEDASFLRQLLVEAVEKSEDKKVIVLIDALNEADDLGLPPGVNKLYLPQILPEGVHFIVTMREIYDEKLYVDNKKYVPLDDKDPKNIEDLKRYIDKFIKLNKAKIDVRIKEWNITVEELIDTLCEKNEGNFQYLHYVLHSIKEGNLNKNSIDRIEYLPSGLESYYKMHWCAMKSEDDNLYKRLQRPVLCFLATAREPINIKMLMEWMSQVQDNLALDISDVLEVIKDWRQFLNVRKSSDGEHLYQIYAKSFIEFLEEEEGLKEFYGMIANNALEKIKLAKERFNK